MPEYILLSTNNSHLNKSDNKLEKITLENEQDCSTVLKWPKENNCVIANNSKSKINKFTNHYEINKVMVPNNKERKKRRKCDMLNLTIV